MADDPKPLHERYDVAGVIRDTESDDQEIRERAQTLRKRIIHELHELEVRLSGQLPPVLGAKLALLRVSLE